MSNAGYRFDRALDRIDRWLQTVMPRFTAAMITAAVVWFAWEVMR